jgi:hypothetical protein
MPRHAAGGGEASLLSSSRSPTGRIRCICCAGRASEGDDAHRCRACSEHESARRARGRIPTPEYSAGRSLCEDPRSRRSAQHMVIHGRSTASMRIHAEHARSDPGHLGSCPASSGQSGESVPPAFQQREERTGRTHPTLPDNVGATHRPVPLRCWSSPPSVDLATGAMDLAVPTPSARRILD